MAIDEADVPEAVEEKPRPRPRTTWEVEVISGAIAGTVVLICICIVLAVFYATFWWFAFLGSKWP